MIVTLRGAVTAKFRDWAVVDVSGVGYKVQMPTGSLRALLVGAQVSLWTHEYVREDRRDLYGFSTPEEYGMFLRLIDVSGVGPKTALAMLGLGDAAEIGKRIERGDALWLSGVPGVGKKTAQKIVLELRGKLAEQSTTEDDDLLAALTNLGYSRDRALEALALAAADATAVEDRLRGALRALGR